MGLILEISWTARSAGLGLFAAAGTWNTESIRTKPKLSWSPRMHNEVLIIPRVLWLLVRPRFWPSRRNGLLHLEMVKPQFWRQIPQWYKEALAVKSGSYCTAICPCRLRISGVFRVSRLQALRRKRAERDSQKLSQSIKLKLRLKQNWVTAPPGKYM